MSICHHSYLFKKFLKLVLTTFNLFFIDRNKNSNGVQTSPPPLTQYIDGFPLPEMFPVECYRAALKYKPRSDDIFIASYPKCGSTWTQYILWLIFKQGEPLTSVLELIHGSPFLEIMSTFQN